MGFFDRIRRLFQGGRVDLRQRFELLREASFGTMSKCFKARDRRTDRIVALKILDAAKTAAFEGRFPHLRKPSEGQIAVSLNHPRLVRTFEYGVSTEGDPFLVMEYLEGTGLNVLLRGERSLLDGRRLLLIRQAAEALLAVHQAGYIHRDICPRNFIVAPDLDSLKLIDFGLTVPATRPFMQPGNRTGTPNYMAPELVRRHPTDQRLDIFALGVTAFEICSSQLPWERGSTGMAAVAHATRPPASLHELRPDIHPALAAAIEACIVQDVNLRTPTVQHFLKAVAELDSEFAAG